MERLEKVMSYIARIVDADRERALALGSAEADAMEIERLFGNLVVGIDDAAPALDEDVLWDLRAAVVDAAAATQARFRRRLAQAGAAEVVPLDLSAVAPWAEILAHS